MKLLVEKYLQSIVKFSEIMILFLLYQNGLASHFIAWRRLCGYRPNLKEKQIIFSYVK